MDPNSMYELAQHHQGEIRYAVQRARVRGRDETPSRDLRRRLRAAATSLLALLA